MQKSSFFDSVNGDRKYSAKEMALYFSSFIGNGIFPNPASTLQVLSKDGMQITVKSGKAWINGYFYMNTDDLTLTLDHADGVLKRKDRVVLRWSLSERSIELAIRKGVYSSSPVSPDIQRDHDVYELALCDILVTTGALDIKQSDITDLRYGPLCGIVSGTVTQIDTMGLFAQYDAIFYEWYNRISHILDESTAGNLYALVNKKCEIDKKKTGLSIPVSGWVANTGDYQLKVTVSVPDLLETDYVMVDIDKNYLDTAGDMGLCPVADEANEGLIFYAKTQPAVAIPFKLTKIR